MRFRAPSVFTAHDLLPRRTAEKRELWKRLLARFDRVVVHTERGRETLARARRSTPVVIPHPVYPSSAERDDDGQTLLALGVIRPYKGLADAVEVVAPARRTRGCSSPATRRCRSTGCATRRAPSGGSAT